MKIYFNYFFILKVNAPIIPGDYYFQFIGCFQLQKPDNYLKFENSTITLCFKYCAYLNLTIVASGIECFCLKNVNMSLKSVENNCHNFMVYDRHYSGLNNFYGVYEIFGN